MINFTVGPVQASDEVRKIGQEQVPYFRTPEFSKLMLENEEMMKEFSKADEKSKVVFITGSGTAAMEAVIMNTLTEKDKALIVNGGSFGQRFVELCELHEIPYSEIKLETGKTLTSTELEKYNCKEYSAFIVNVHETSTGVYYDMDMISEFCKRNKLFLIVDAISSFLADPFDMKKLNVDIMITGSQKALACPPGISIIVMSENAIKRVEQINAKCLYLNLKAALKNAERGQTPFTPAVGILRQINCEKETEKISKIAEDFRSKIQQLPFEIVSDNMSNAVTPLHPTSVSAYDIFMMLKDEYGIWVCPNGGKLKDDVFRVGHIGNLSVEDNNKLIEALKDMQDRGLI